MRVDRGEQASSRLIALTRPLGSWPRPDPEPDPAGWTPGEPSWFVEPAASLTGPGPEQDPDPDLPGPDPDLPRPDPDLPRPDPDPSRPPRARHATGGMVLTADPDLDEVPAPDGEPGRRRVGVRAAATVLVLAFLVALGVVARTVFSDAGQRVEASAATVPRDPAGPGGTASRRSRGSAAAASGDPVLSGTPGPLLGGPADAGVVVVDVVGRVRHPGLARLPPGARVADAIAAAGGPAPGAAVTRVNLARRVVDGEQVVVPGPHDPLPVGASGPGPAGGGAAGGGTDGPLDLNSATVSQLDGLPGVGPVTAGRIVAWRTQHQRFSRVEELGEVQGIGPKMLEHLRPLVRV